MKELTNDEIKFILINLIEMLNGTMFFTQEENEKLRKRNNHKKCKEILGLL